MPLPANLTPGEIRQMIDLWLISCLYDYLQRERPHGLALFLTEKRNPIMNLAARTKAQEVKAHPPDEVTPAVGFGFIRSQAVLLDCSPLRAFAMQLEFTFEAHNCTRPDHVFGS